ncbi:MAG: hypothetical protein SH820_04730, partial [Xanthomonadales bacterium]|nr:hypothetical protein [Xanthomonadales bacterium]
FSIFGVRVKIHDFAQHYRQESGDFTLTPNILAISAGVASESLPVSDHRDAGGTSPGMGEGRTMQEQLSRAMSGTIAEKIRPIFR